MSYAIETRALTKKFQYGQTLIGALKRKRPEEIPALADVSLQVPEQDVFGLIGPNSSGKTTLINILCTSLIPTSGAAYVGGFDVTKHPESTRPLIGLVTSNERSFYWRLSGRENLRFFASLYKLQYKSVSGWIEELIDGLDLKSFASRRFDSYSTGVRQRFAVARALLHKPRILFMDEPTKGLDPIAAATFIGVIRQKIIHTWNPTVLITSHNLREIEQLCGSLAILHKGRIVCSGRVEELERDAVPYETYNLIVGNIEDRVLDSIGKLPGVLGVDASRANGNVDLAIRLKRSGESISPVLRLVLSNGGEIYRCNQSAASLESVFNHVISPSEH